MFCTRTAALGSAPAPKLSFRRCWGKEYSTVEKRASTLLFSTHLVTIAPAAGHAPGGPCMPKPSCTGGFISKANRRAKTSFRSENSCSLTFVPPGGGKFWLGVDPRRRVPAARRARGIQNTIEGAVTPCVLVLVFTSPALHNDSTQARHTTLSHPQGGLCMHVRVRACCLGRRGAQPAGEVAAHRKKGVSRQVRCSCRALNMPST